MPVNSSSASGNSSSSDSDKVSATNDVAANINAGSNSGNWRRTRALTINSWTGKPDYREDIPNVDENGRTKDTGVLVTEANAQDIFPANACAFVAK